MKGHVAGRGGAPEEGGSAQEGGSVRSRHSRGGGNVREEYPWERTGPGRRGT